MDNPFENTIFCDAKLKTWLHTLMNGSTDVEYLHNATLEMLENLITELTDERFLFDYIQTLN